MESNELQKFVNQIFAKKGIPAVKNLAADFSDAILYQQLFNILYDERVDCKLIKSPLLDVKMQNWNKINATICFNYLQQQFYLVAPTMKALAQGKNQQVIETMIKHLINSTQGSQFDTYLDDDAIRDIADVVETDKQLYNEDEAQMLNQSSHGAAVQVEGKSKVQLNESDMQQLQKSAEKNKQNIDDDNDFSRDLNNQ